MASIVKLGKGKSPPRAIDFIDVSNGERKRWRVRLGVVTHEEAREAKGRIERLAAVKGLGQTPDPATIAWLASVSDVIHARLAKAGLCEPREPVEAAPALSAYLDKLLGQRAAELKPGSVRRLRQTAALLLDKFGADVRLDEITVEAAADWRAGLLAAKKAEATVRLHCRNAKSIFTAAVERELIGRNPFSGLKSAALAAERERYITPDETARILDACPSLAWRVLVGLARYAGLRVPSESDGLTWGHVDWERRRLSVYAPKTGKTRSVPIVAELHGLLSEAFDAAPEGSERIVTLPKNNRHRTLHAILKRAGLEPWSDLFQALRRSCETWLATTHPQHCVAAWIGHSPRVSREFYLQTTDEHFDKATGIGACAAQSAAESARIDRQRPASVSSTVMPARATAHEKSPETACFAGFLDAPPPGLEPGTRGLTVRCSTN